MYLFVFSKIAAISALSGGLQCTFRRTLICLFGSLLVSAVLSWTRATGSLAGGFLVAVVGFAPVAVAGSSVVTRLPYPLVLRDSFTFSPAQWASPQLNGPVQFCMILVNRNSLLTGP